MKRQLAACHKILFLLLLHFSRICSTCVAYKDVLVFEFIFGKLQITAPRLTCFESAVQSTRPSPMCPRSDLTPYVKAK